MLTEAETDEPDAETDEPDEPDVGTDETDALPAGRAAIKWSAMPKRRL